MQDTDRSTGSDDGYGKDWNPADHYKESDVAESYDAERFTSLAGRAFDRLEKGYIRKAFAGLATGARVADIPCGTGRLAETLLEHGFDVSGFDISAAMLEVAGRRLKRFGPRFAAKVGDARRMDSPTDPFDAVLCARVLMHFPLPEQIDFLKGAARLTKGPVVITHSLDTPYQRFRRWIKRRLRHANPVSYPLADADIRRLLDGAGLREVRRFRPMPLLTEEIILVAEKT